MLEAMKKGTAASKQSRNYLAAESDPTTLLELLSIDATKQSRLAQNWLVAVGERSA
jgi:high-affinity K+ transport system ATPase subunit B